MSNDFAYLVKAKPYQCEATSIVYSVKTAAIGEDFFCAPLNSRISCKDPLFVKGHYEGHFVSWEFCVNRTFTLSVVLRTYLSSFSIINQKKFARAFTRVQNSLIIMESF